MIIGIISSLIASVIAGIGTLAWRNRKNLAILTVVLMPVGTVRVSLSTLLRIKEGDRYVLFHTPYTPGSYGPPGGVVKFHHSAQQHLDRFSFREELRAAHAGVMQRDLRGFVPARRLASFLRWFHSGSGRESATECLRRELREELSEIGYPDLRAEVESLAFRFVRRVAEPPRKVPGRDYRQVRLFEVYDLETGDEAASRLSSRLLDSGRDANDQRVILASSQDIVGGRYGELFIGPQSAFLFGTRRYRQDIPPVARA
ncbi:SMODS-associated NUDIX domain-containing protein [Nonomuraea aurantiaca]|uniref:SMODS-associated NUDIX domain-containing protein n=1 Tax=Nonomuraea aurantiaca TaxID=2878562 RepID=UPI001CD94213|nr:hypothetical protein [Nonomuraea aurantiaca]MCA2227376.1 hypothetical protein [Nonomuraea aurantiaca]